ncbi:MAG: stage II sporulation protein R [Clostridia bacterium]|nr:stage II sporulation protein R [Clostridia bacterium]
MRTKTDRLTVFLVTLSILTLFVLPLRALLPTAEDAAIYDSILRLHVLANSDSAEDQALKLAVRDGILATVAGLVEGIHDFDEVCAAVDTGIPAIEAAAREVLAREGSDYDVRVTLTKEHYPTRTYENVTLPSGTYTSLRVLIGEAEGANWWCVLFPQLCVNMASETTFDRPAVIDETDEMGALIEAGLTPSQIELITGSEPRVIIRFRLLEWLDELLSRG